MDIADWRKKIDDIDRRLVRLLNDRSRCAIEIGKIKRQNGLPIRDSTREEEVLRHALDANQGPLDEPAIRRVFHAILNEGRGVEEALFNDQRTTSQGSNADSAGEPPPRGIHSK
jgi:chorismate mutase